MASDGSEVLELIQALAQGGTYGDYEATCYSQLRPIRTADEAPKRA
jgi:hypothetical protein